MGVRPTRALRLARIRPSGVRPVRAIGLVGVRHRAGVRPVGAHRRCVLAGVRLTGERLAGVRLVGAHGRTGLLAGVRPARERLAGVRLTRADLRKLCAQTRLQRWFIATRLIARVVMRTIEQVVEVLLQEIECMIVLAFDG